MGRWIRGIVVAGIAALAAGAGCAHSQTGSEPGHDDKAASEPTPAESASAESADSPHAERRDTPRRMGPSRVYTREEIESTGEPQLDRALHRLGHRPR